MLAIPAQWELVQWTRRRPGDCVFRPHDGIFCCASKRRHAMLIGTAKTGFYAPAMRRLGSFIGAAMV
jgi:hypothetical protein